MLRHCHHRKLCLCSFWALSVAVISRVKELLLKNLLLKLIWPLKKSFFLFLYHWFTVLEKHIIIKCPVPTQINYITPDKQKTDRNKNICLSGRTENLPITHSLQKAQIKTLLSRFLCRQVVTECCIQGASPFKGTNRGFGRKCGILPAAGFSLHLCGLGGSMG